MAVANFNALTVPGEVVKSTTLTGNGTISANPCRVKAIQGAFSAAGTVVLNDGGVAALTITGRVNTTTDTIVPGGGQAFATNCTAVLTNVSGVTVFFANG